jgi:hypothetical protein
MQKKEYDFKEIIEIAYDYVRCEILPKLQRKIYGIDIMFNKHFIKWGCCIDYYVTFDNLGKIILNSLIIKVSRIGRETNVIQSQPLAS